MGFFKQILLFVENASLLHLSSLFLPLEQALLLPAKGVFLASSAIFTVVALPVFVPAVWELILPTPIIPSVFLLLSCSPSSSCLGKLLYHTTALLGLAVILPPLIFFWLPHSFLFWTLPLAAFLHTHFSLLPFWTPAQILSLFCLLTPTSSTLLPLLIPYLLLQTPF